MDILLRRTVSLRTAEFQKLVESNVAAHHRTARVSRLLTVASEESNERLKEIREDITRGIESEKTVNNEPRTGDVLNLARRALERVQKH